MRFHPQKQQIKNSRWKNKIGFLLFALELFRRKKKSHVSDGGKPEMIFLVSVQPNRASSAFVLAGPTREGVWKLMVIHFRDVAAAAGRDKSHLQFVQNCLRTNI